MSERTRNIAAACEACLEAIYQRHEIPCSPNTLDQVSSLVAGESVSISTSKSALTSSTAEIAC